MPRRKVCWLEFKHKEMIVRIKRQVVVITPTAPITEGYGDKELVEFVFGLIESGHRFFVLDMSRSHLRGSSISALVQIFNKLHGLKGKIKLCCLDLATIDKLNISKLIDIFEIFTTKEAALESFKD